MKNFSIYSVIVMIASAVLTWQAIAIPATTIHIVQNLSPEDASIAQKIIDSKGYKTSSRPLFSESKETLLITKALGNETEPASIQVEVVYQAEEKSIPKTIFNLKLETKDIGEVLQKLPTPDKLKQSINIGNDSMPVAFQSSN